MKRRSIGPSVSFFAFQDIITAVVGIFILITLILVLELTQRVEKASSPPVANLDEIVRTIDLLTSETHRLTDEYNERISGQSEFASLNEFNRSYETEKLNGRIRASTDQIDKIQAQLDETNQRIKNEKDRSIKLLADSAALEDERDRVAKLKQEILEQEQAISRLQKTDGLIYRDATDDGRMLSLLTLDGSGITIQDAASKQVHRFHSRDWHNDLKEWLSQTNLRSRHILLLLRPSGVNDFDSVRELLKKNGSVYGFDVVAEDFGVTLGFQWSSKP